MCGRVARRLVLGVFFVCASVSGARAGHYTWTTSGPEPGLVYQIVVDPADSDALFTVASYYGPYLFRTTNRGARWDYVESTAGYRFIVRDPAHPGVFYAAYRGVSKSVDGGRTWRVWPIDGSVVQALALAPSAPATLYAVTGSNPGHVFRSTDGAATWTLVSSNLPGNSWNLAVDPVNPLVVYAATYPALLKSVDGGTTWNLANAGLPSSAVLVRIDAGAPSRLYAATDDSGVYASTDAGATWNPANEGLEWQHIQDLAIDPANPSRIFAASWGGAVPAGPGGIYLSVDAGTTWSLVDLGIGGLVVGSAVTIDDRNSSLVYAGVGSSVLRGNVLRSEDGGATWTVVNDGLSGYFSYGVAARPGAATRAYGISGPNVYETSNGGGTWNLLASLQYSMTSLLVDPSDPMTLYAGYQSGSAAGMYKSIDGGAIWSDSSVGLTPTNKYRLAIGRSDPQTLLASADDGIFRTTDGGGTWTNVLGGLGRGVAIDPADPLILYAGRGYEVGQNGFLRSDDGGTTWNPPGGMPSVEASALDVEIDPSRPSYVYASIGFGIYRSIDRGLSFAPANTGIPLSRTSVRLSRNRPLEDGDAVRFDGVVGLVFRSTDSAGSWSPLPSGVPSLTVLDFSVGATGRTLYAASVGGIFQFDRSFADVPDAAPIWPFVDAAAMNGLTAGCGEGMFCPGRTVTRAQAAVFLVKAAKGAAFVPPPATGSLFADVPATSFAAAWIEELAERGRDGGLRLRPLLSERGDPPRPDGGPAAAGEARHGVHAAARDGNGLRRRAGERVRRGVDRGALSRGPGRRMRRREFLPGRRDDARSGGDAARGRIRPEIGFESGRPRRAG